MKAKHSLLTAASIIASITHSSWVQSQSVEPPAGTSSERLQLEEIIVTAQKRSENLQSVPVAVSVLTADELRTQNIYDATQLQYYVPSLQQQSTNNQVGATNFFIRGVGTAIYGPAVESTVATVIDDVVMGRPAMGVVQFFDVERVEVLRGPQGMLFGKNASAGLVNIVTTPPRLDRVETLAHLSYGQSNSGSSGDELIAQGALNLPVTDNSAVRISAFSTEQDGFGKNVYRDEDLGLSEYGARIKYLWQPSDSLEIFIAGDYAHESGPAGSVLFRRVDAAGGFVAGQDAAAGVAAGPENVEIASNASTDNLFELGGVQARIVYSFAGGYSLTNIAAFRSYRDHSDIDSDQLPIRFFDMNRQGREQQQLSNELRLTSPVGGSLEYQLGLYYLDLRDEGSNTLGADLQPFFPAPPPGFVANLGSAGSSNVRNESYAAFGQAKLAITKSTRAIFGGRVTHDDIDASGRVDSSGFVVPFQPSGTSSAGLTKTNFSYRVGAEMDVTATMLGYLTYSRGYKAPTFGGASGTAAIRAEIPTNIEAGLKSALLDNKLSLNVALYHVEFKDFQAQAFDPQALRFTTTNAGKLRTRGAELDFRAVPWERLSLSGGFAYNDATYESFPGVACHFGQPNGTSGRDVCLPNGTTDATGNQLAFAPKWTGSLIADYLQPLGGLDAFVTASYYYRSSVNFTASHDPRTEVGGYGLVGGSIGVQTQDARIRAALFARNLLDKRVPTFIVADVTSGLNGDAALGGNYWQQFGETSFRTVGVCVDLRF